MKKGKIKIKIVSCITCSGTGKVGMDFNPCVFCNATGKLKIT